LQQLAINFKNIPKIAKEYKAWSTNAEAKEEKRAANAEAKEEKRAANAKAKEEKRVAKAEAKVEIERQVQPQTGDKDLETKADGSFVGVVQRASRSGFEATFGRLRLGTQLTGVEAARFRRDHMNKNGYDVGYEREAKRMKMETQVETQVEEKTRQLVVQPLDSQLECNESGFVGVSPCKLRSGHTNKFQSWFQSCFYRCPKTYSTSAHLTEVEPARVRRDAMAQHDAEEETRTTKREKKAAKKKAAKAQMEGSDYDTDSETAWSTKARSTRGRCRETEPSRRV